MMKIREYGKRVESDMAVIVEKYKALAIKAGFDFWDITYEFWPNHKTNTQWTCTLGLKNTMILAGQGFAETPHQAYQQALTKAKRK